MADPSDLDQGGVSRQWVRTYLGPSIGWVLLLVDNVYPITAGGIFNIPIGTTLVTVKANADVTINLPSGRALPGLPTSMAGLPLTVVDIGGFAAVHGIDVFPIVGETIMGLPSVSIDNAFGSMALRPNTVDGGWVQQ